MYKRHQRTNDKILSLNLGESLYILYPKEFFYGPRDERFRGTSHAEQPRLVSEL